jgi:hypothetical protein
MINRGATLISRLAVLFAVLFTFTACGGGGGGGNAFYQGDGSDNPSLGFTLLDPQGNPTSSISFSSPGTLKITVQKGGSNIVVSASTDDTIATLSPATALTDGGGVATFLLEAVAQGAGTITASAQVNGETITGDFGYQVGESGLRLGYFDSNGDFIENQISILPAGTLSAGGNAQLSVVILDQNGERVTSSESIRFNSGCIGSGQATISPANPVLSVNGQASTTYTAAGCGGVDSITASLAGASAQATGSISIASPQANAVTFVSATPTLIVLRGTGGANRPETAEVIFQVVDGTGAPIAGISTALSLSTSVGGLSLSKSSALSDGDGQVKVTVSSGDVATSVRVIATIDNGSGKTVATASDLITVTTGLPDQNSISLSVAGTFVVENGFVEDGITRSLNVRMADKFNNPVVDGTAAVFTTEYGAIVGSCTTVAGTCSVLWNTQAPRFPTLTGDDYVVSTENDAGITCPSHTGDPIPCPDDLGYTRGGRSTILVHAIGEESFVDRNGNGIMDEDERYLFQNLPEAFLDNNEDGYYTPALPACLADPYGSPQCIAGLEEIFIDFNSNEEYDYNDDPPVYNGLLCPPEGNGVWCSRELVNVRALSLVVLSDPTSWNIIMVYNKGIVGGAANGRIQTAYVSDRYNNPPPGGSTISVSAEGDCNILSATSITVPNTGAAGAFGFPVEASDDDPFTAGSLNITLTAIGGSSFTKTFSCGTFTDCSLSPLPEGCPTM